LSLKYEFCGRYSHRALPPQAFLAARPTRQTIQRQTNDNIHWFKTSFSSNLFGGVSVLFDDFLAISSHFFFCEMPILSIGVKKSIDICE